MLERQTQSLGMETLTGLSVVQGLTPPPKAVYALLQPTGQAVRWRDDTDPTSTVGHLIPKNKRFRYIGPLSKIRFLEAVASATLTVTYYAPI